MPYSDRPRRGGYSSGSGRSGGFSHGPRRGGFGGGRSFDRGPRPMHKATCSDCGQECEVPFRPTEGRPVYCRDCYNKRKDNPEMNTPAVSKPLAPEATAKKPKKAPEIEEAADEEELEMLE